MYFDFQDFFAFASQRGLFRKVEPEDKTVFVVPAFEMKESIAPPKHKKELIKLSESGNVRPFYIQLCWKCQVCVCIIGIIVQMAL